MSPEIISRICSTIAFAGLLIFIPFWRSSDKFITGIVITLLCIVYAWLVSSNFSLSGIQKFNSLNGVMELFFKSGYRNCSLGALPGVRLITGLFISGNEKNARDKVLADYIPCLFFTFMPEPLDLLRYFIMRAVVIKKYFPLNFPNSIS